MSYLRPTGVPVNFDGVDRCFLFTFKHIDELQFRHPALNIFRQVEAATEDTLDGLIMLIDLVDVLCDGEIRKDEIPKILKQNVLTGEGNLTTVRSAISLALIDSMPEPNEEIEDENNHGDTGLFEIPKFIMIATSKFGMSEAEAWTMTPRKFALLNDAFMEINGLKKKEDHMSLLDLP
jgi:hypothetical protein